MTTPQWEYRVETFLNIEAQEAKRMQNDLNWLGSEGWELVGMSTTVKRVALVGNEIVCVFKRPGVGSFTPREDPNAGWG